MIKPIMQSTEGLIVMEVSILQIHILSPVDFIHVVVDVVDGIKLYIGAGERDHSQASRRTLHGYVVDALKRQETI